VGYVLAYLHQPSACQVGYSCQALLRSVFSVENLFEIVKIPYNMSDKGLESFLVRCNAKERMHSLDLSYCRHLTGCGLGPLLGSSIVEVLDLRSMPCLSYTSVLPVLRSMSFMVLGLFHQKRKERKQEGRASRGIPRRFEAPW
jgi:hypothetical protein